MKSDDYMAREYREAFGLLSTALPGVRIDVDAPIQAAAEIAREVERLRAKLERIREASDV